MNNKSKIRISYVDIVKFIGIFLLLIEHSGNWITLDGSYNNLKIWICSFHMPLFFIVSGLVISDKPVKTVKEFANILDKRIKNLIIPYIIWCLIYQNGLNPDFYLGVLYGTNTSLGMAQTNQVLWFLPAMFVSMIMFQLVVNINGIIRIKKYIKVIMFIEAMVLSAISIFLKLYRGNLGMPWGIDIAFMGCSFIIFGFLLKEYIDRLFYKKYLAFAVAGICLCVGYYIAIHNQPDEIWVSIMALGMYGHNWILYIVGAICNTVVMIIISNALGKINFFAWLGRNSMTIMVVHYILFPYTVNWAVKLLNGYDILIAICNAVFTVILCIPITILIEHYAPILKGK